MYFINIMLCVFYIALGSFAIAAPLCSNITDVAGGGLPNSNEPLLISPAAVKDFQLALFLENLEASFFSSGLANITKWDTYGYPNNTIEIVSKVVAVSNFLLVLATSTDVYIARRSPRRNYRRSS